MDAYRKQFDTWKTSSPKSQDAVALRQIKERGALPMIDRRYPSGNRPLQQYLGFTAGRWLWSVRHKADSLIAKFKEAGGTVREIDGYRVTGWLSALAIASSSACHGLLIITVDNAITYKVQRRDKNARELKFKNAAITFDMQMRQRDVKQADAKYTKELRC